MKPIRASKLFEVPSLLFLILLIFAAQLLALVCTTALELIGLLSNHILTPICASSSDLLKRMEGVRDGYEAVTR